MSMAYSIISFFLGTLFLWGQGIAKEQESGNRVNWIENSGFYIDTPQGGILIDALLNPDDEIARAEGVFSKVKLIFISHVHGNHFNATAVLKHLRANKEAHVILTPEAYKVLQDKGLSTSLKSRISISYPEENALEPFQSGPFSGHILRFNHSGVENIGLGLRGKEMGLVYLNGGVTHKEVLGKLGERYGKTDLVIANKWPLVRAHYIDSIKTLFSPRWILMAHHSGRTDNIVTQNGGADAMEKAMQRGITKGKIFGKRMESIAF